MIKIISMKEWLEKYGDKKFTFVIGKRYSGRRYYLEKLKKKQEENKNDK